MPTNVFQPWAGVDLPPLLKNAARTDRQGVCRVVEQIPAVSGSVEEARRLNLQRCTDFENGPGHC